MCSVLFLAQEIELQHARALRVGALLPFAATREGEWSFVVQGCTALCARARAGNHVGVGVQRLDVLVAVLLARERTNSGGLSCLTPLTLMLAALPSRPLEMVADVLASYEYAEVPRPEEAPVESDFEIVGAAGVADSRRTVGAFPRSRRGVEATASGSGCTVS